MTTDDITLDQYRDAALAQRVGYAVDSGYESLEKVGRDAWLFTGEDGVRSRHSDAEAGEIFEDVFPGSPAAYFERFGDA